MHVTQALIAVSDIIRSLIFVSPAKHSGTKGSLCPVSVCPCVCLSHSHTFLVFTHSYVSQGTHAFLGMLPLSCVTREKKCHLKITKFVSHPSVCPLIVFMSRKILRLLVPHKFFEDLVCKCIHYFL